ncbi:putative integral membrane protein [Micromonospora sp. B006]|nr:putative integral membrane protein [Micromonospora sp. B006]
MAALGDLLPLPLAALILLAVALLTALAWYFFPAWVPRRLPRFRLPRLRRPRLPRLRLPRLRRPARRRSDPPPVRVPAPRTPDAVPADAPGLADRLAAEGRYAEAVRERLREMVRLLVVRHVVEPRPGLTVVELTEAAARARPQVRPTLHTAGAIFSDLWYAQRPATAAHDRRMRELAADLRRELTGEEPR